MFNLVDSVTSGHIVLEPESNNTITKRIIETYNPIFRPMSNVIKTESGYTVIIPPQNIGGTKVEVEKLGGGQYLVLKTPSYFGARTERIIMTEDELVKEFNGFQLKKDQKKADLAKFFKMKNPYDYFLTKNGYVIKSLNGNNMTGAKTEIKERPDGTYLVKTTAYPGCPAEIEILTEQELISKYKGEKYDDNARFNNLVT